MTDPVVVRRIVDMVERQGAIKSVDFLKEISQEVPEREITLDLARGAVAARYGNQARRAKTKRGPLGRKRLLSVRREDGWYVVSAARFGPTESELMKAYHEKRRRSAERAIDFNERLVSMLQANQWTYAEISDEAWVELIEA